MGLVRQSPRSPVEPVVDLLHGVPIADPYRWLEDQNSPRTRAWIEAQTLYARTYLGNLPGRETIRERVRELVDIEAYDSFLMARNRVFFRKRLAGQEQPCLYFRDGVHGHDQLLLDPATRGTGSFTALKPLRVSSDGSHLLYEVKQGGERTGVFEILSVSTGSTLADSLPHGYLWGFAFAPDAKGFFYVHQPANSERRPPRTAFHHVFGTSFAADAKIFEAGDDERLRLTLVSGPHTIGFLVYRFLDRTYTDFYLWRIGSRTTALPILHRAAYKFAPRLIPGRILALTDRDAPNFRIVEVQPRKNQEPLFFDLVPESDSPIRDWVVTRNHILVSYLQGTHFRIAAFDLFGKTVGDLPSEGDCTIRIAAACAENDEVIFERESFTQPVETISYNVATGTRSLWARRRVPFDAASYGCSKLCFSSTDGTSIPMFLVGRRDLLRGGTHPVVMTSYGGFGIPATPQFSALVAILLEHGCLFALPNIRGGSEFGSSWHNAAKRRHRQVAIDDFLSSAEWLIRTGRTDKEHLAILGGSNSGLLVGAALTQRPDLFRAVVCLAPLCDMLRYHLFDNAHAWAEEFGTAEDSEDFAALLKYSPYHAIRENVSYPPTMIVSGDADQNCNALHARKMIARLQAATSSSSPILLDYSQLRGHSAVLPLTVRIDALTDRLAFIIQQIGLRV